MSKELYSFEVSSMDLRAGCIQDRNTADEERFKNVVARQNANIQHLEEGNRVASGSGLNYKVRVVFEAVC